MDMLNKPSREERISAINQVSEICANELKYIAKQNKEEALSLVIKEHGKSLLALEGIVEVLVKHGADPNLAARLGMRYWALGWDKRLEDALRSSWKFTEEDMAKVKWAIDLRLAEYERSG